MYLIDTDVLIDFLAGRPRGLSLFAELVNLPLSMSVVTVGEYYVGVHRSKHPDTAHARFAKFADAIPARAVNDGIIHLYAEIRAALLDRGDPIPDFDIIIAATAIYHDLTLVTRNVKHFGRIDGLRIYPDR